MEFELNYIEYRGFSNFSIFHLCFMSRQEMVITMLGDNHNTVIFIMKLGNLQQLLLYSTQNLLFAKENHLFCCQMNNFAHLVERYNAHSAKLC